MADWLAVASGKAEGRLCRPRGAALKEADLQLSASHLAASRSLRSWKPTAGRATREVSSKNTLVALKGIAYRKVGIRLLASRISGLPCSKAAEDSQRTKLSGW